MATLSAAQRKQLPASAFVFPGSRSFPIHDENHAKAALSFAGRKGGSVQAKVKASVYRRYPNLKPGGLSSQVSK